MHVVAVISPKGGAGKTTLAMNLSSQLASMDLRVRLFDLDPQASATRWAKRDVSRKIEFTVVPLRCGSDHCALSDALRADPGLDIVVIDTPPQRSADINTCLRCADVALIPVTPSPLDLWGAQDALQEVLEVQQKRNRGRPLALLVPSRLIVGTLLARTLPGTLEGIGGHVAPPIHQTVAVAEAAIAGETIREYAPRNRAAEDFDRVANYVLDKLHSRAESQQ
jgi:chromosome partitioning protein